jgi:hypothetical protein
VLLGTNAGTQSYTFAAALRAVGITEERWGLQAASI